MIERGPLYFQEDSRTSTSFHFLQAGPTSNLQVFGDKSIGASFIQTVRELLTCFDPPTNTDRLELIGFDHNYIVHVNQPGPANMPSILQQLQPEACTWKRKCNQEEVGSIHRETTR